MSSASDIPPKELMSRGVSYVAAAVIHPDIEDMKEQINSLKHEIVVIRRDLEDMKAQLGREAVPEALPSREIMDAIALYLKKEKEAYPSDIADALGISVREVLAALSILKQERKVAEV